MRTMAVLAALLMAQVVYAQLGGPDDDARQRAQAEYEAKKTAMMNAIRADRTKMGTVFGAAMCYAREIRRQSRTEIAKEDRYSAESGVTSLERRDQLKRRLRWADDAETAFHEKLRGWKGLHVPPCSDRIVQSIVACKLDDQKCAGEVGLMAGFIDDAPGVDDR